MRKNISETICEEIEGLYDAGLIDEATLHKFRKAAVKREAEQERAKELTIYLSKPTNKLDILIDEFLRMPLARAMKL